MTKSTTKYRISTLAAKRKKDKSFSSNPTREEIERAIQEYLAKGGKITKVEPEWIEEGRLYISG